MTEAGWRKELEKAGLTESGIQRALPLVGQLQAMLDDLTAEMDRDAPNLAERRKAPWEAASFLRRVVDAVALRDEVTRRYFGLRE